MVWGWAVFAALYTAIRAVAAGVNGDGAEMALASAFFVVAVLAAYGIDRLAEPLHYSKPRSKRQGLGSWDYASKRLGRLAISAALIAVPGIAAVQVDRILDKGIGGWLTGEATGLGELIVVTALLLLLLGLVVWGLWVIGERAYYWVYAQRLKHAWHETRDRRAEEAAKSRTP